MAEYRSRFHVKRCSTMRPMVIGFSRDCRHLKLAGFLVGGSSPVPGPKAASPGESIMTTSTPQGGRCLRWEVFKASGPKPKNLLCSRLNRPRWKEALTTKSISQSWDKQPGLCSLLYRADTIHPRAQIMGQR